MKWASGVRVSGRFVPHMMRYCELNQSPASGTSVWSPNT